MVNALVITGHALLFLAAVLIFYLGLGIGLIVNPAAGTALWFLAAAIGLGNLWWTVRSIRRMTGKAG